MSALLKCNVLQQYLLEARVMSSSSNSCYKVLQGLTRMRARKSEQFIQLLRMNLVTGIVLYCKVLVSCRGPTYVTICKWYFKLNTLKTLLTYLLCNGILNGRTQKLTLRKNKLMLKRIVNKKISFS